MSTPETTQRERVRVFATGACEGFEKLRESLAGHPEIELVGSSATVADGAAALAGGHLDAVLHATRSASLPADELAAIREHTRAPLLIVPSSGSSQTLAGYTWKHIAGLDVLPAPLRPEDAELVTEAKLGRLLEVARESYDSIVVDTSPFFHGPMLATLDRTDELLLLSSLDVPTLKNLRLALQTLELLSFPKQRIRIVLNRSNSKVGMKQNEVESALGMKVRFEVPSDSAVPLAVNRGKPVVLDEEGADVSRAIRSMAKNLFPVEEAAKKQRRLLPAFARS